MSSTSNKYCDQLKLEDYFHIQPFGYLVVLSIASEKIVAASYNIKEIFSCTARQTIGQHLNTFTAKNISRTLNKFLKYQDSQSEIIIDSLKQESRSYTISLTKDENYIYCDIEHIDNTILNSNPTETTLTVIEVLNNLNKLDDPKKLYKQVLDTVMKTTDYDSIMLYEYDDDLSGKVLDQKKKSFMPNFKNHHFPASDTPQQVRKAFIEKPVRYIPDIHYKKVRIACLKKDRKKINLTMSVLRGVVPIHIQFLNNMKSSGSASFPIIVNQKLWGIISLHSHSSKKHITIMTRRLIYLITNLLSSKIEQFKLDEENTNKKRTLKLLDKYSSLTEDSTNLIDTLKNMQLKLIKSIIDCDGFNVFVSDYSRYEGKSFSRESALKIFENFASKKHSLVKLSSADIQSAIKHNPDNICGALLVVIDYKLGIFLLISRISKVENIAWAGNHAKQNASKKIAPRNSFSTWIEEKKQEITHWKNTDIIAASQLRQTLSDILLRQTLSALAYTDTLTELFNRRYLEEEFKSYCDSLRRHHSTICLAIIDIDLFKDVNDTHGHDAGDIVLSGVAKALKSSFRQDDLICRLGGEEFIVIMPAPLKDAAEKCDQFRKKIARSKFKLSAKKFTKITISIGLVHRKLTNRAINLKQFISTADANLYEAKENGRNKVVV